ncbi:hypothetical protein WN51_03491, partial [Melipona quadrifasciata]
NAKNVTFHHDNIRTILKKKKELREFDWEILLHPPYLPIQIIIYLDCFTLFNTGEKYDNIENIVYNTL